MTLFQDKKLIMHISLEIVVLGSMGYFFYNRTNKLNHRIEQMSQLISALQNDTKDLREQIQNIQKQQTTKIASVPVLVPVETDEDYKLFKMFRERELKEQKIRSQSQSIPIPKTFVKSTRPVTVSHDEFVTFFSNQTPIRNNVSSIPNIEIINDDNDNDNDNDVHHDVHHDNIDENNENEVEQINEKEKDNKKIEDENDELDRELGPELEELNISK